MFEAVTTLYLYVETPLHAGVGSGLSAVDLPIQRERTTQYPMIQGSGIKGKLRSVAEGELEKLKKRVEKSGSKEDQEKVKAFKERLWEIFGPDTSNAPDHASALMVSDARILLFPVRSLGGVYAYVTSADVLNRFKRDFERDGKKKAWEDATPVIQGNEQAFVTANSQITLDNTNVVLEELSYTVSESAILGNIAAWIAENAFPSEEAYAFWRNKLQHSLILLPDNDFRDFALYSTEIITRVRILRESKTVDKGALWTEEHLPTDTLLYAPVYATGSRKNGSTLSAEEVITEVKKLGSDYLQLGGDETVGRGIVRISWQPDGRNTQ
jgi:CRISPR-associated protein Cmr4